MAKFQKKLESYVQQYFAAHPEVKLVAIAGTVGKTQTKQAIGRVLATKYRVGMNDDTDSNQLLTPLSILGINKPAKTGFWERRAILKAAKLRVTSPATVDIIVQELNAEQPGDMQHYVSYLRPNIVVVTGITVVKLLRFATIEALAAEIMTINQYAETVLINRDDTDARFAELLTNPHMSTYGSSGVAEFRFEDEEYSIANGYKGTIVALDQASQSLQLQVVGEHSVRPLMAAVAVGTLLGMNLDDIAAVLTQMRPLPGRMNLLRGLDGTHIIDDSYSTNPASAIAALQALYTMEAPSRIAVFSSMANLGVSAAAAHTTLGEACNPDLLSWVVTVGPEAEQFLAPAARSRGCQVKSVQNAIQAGEFVRSITEEGALILVKGSKYDMYLEETVKTLCNMTEDAQLVRQSPEELAVKQLIFSQIS